MQDEVEIWMNSHALGGGGGDINSGTYYGTFMSSDMQDMKFLK